MFLCILDIRMKGLLPIVTIVSIFFVGFFHKEIPIKDPYFYPILVLIFPTFIFYFEFIYDLYEGKNNQWNRSCAGYMLPIWVLVTITYYNAGLIPHAVVSCIFSATFFGIYAVINFLHFNFNKV